jgi:hypothetical protein
MEAFLPVGSEKSRVALLLEEEAEAFPHTGIILHDKNHFLVHILLKKFGVMSSPR